MTTLQIETRVLASIKEESYMLFVNDDLYAILKNIAMITSKPTDEIIKTEVHYYYNN